MDFRLTEEQMMLQRIAHEFAEKEVRPVARELDAKTDPKECFSWELVKKASKLGFRTASVPEEYGGQGLDLLSLAVMLEELAWGDAGFPFALFTILQVGRVLPMWSKQQRDEFVPKIVQDDTYLMGLATTEPDGATEWLLPYDAPGAALKTFAERKGDEYIINGTKRFITMSPVAKLLIVHARTIRDAPITKSWSTFLVPTDTPGFHVSRIKDTFGLRLSINGEDVVFEDVHIPHWYRLGEENTGYDRFQRNAPVGLALRNSISVGLLRATYEEALNYARSRVVCGKPIIEHPTIAIMLSDMRVKIEAARLLVWKCAWNLEHHTEDKEYNLHMAYLTKAFINEIAVTVMANGDEILGGMGTDKDMPMEKYLRDILSLSHGSANRSLALLKGAPTLG